MDKDAIASGQGTRCDGCEVPTPAQCHCTVCHNTFGTVSSFDKHRRNGECINPLRIGLVLVGDVWRYPPDERMEERKRHAREEAAR